MRLRALLLASISLSACAPITPYRYTGLTPAPRPIAWDGYPSHAGEVHAELSGSHTSVYENLFPQVHDTALHVAATTVEGAASITPVRGLDIGVRASYAAYAWSRPSAVGTMPLPSRPNLWGVGPEVRGAFFVDHGKHMAIGLAANLMHYQVPWAAYALDTATTTYKLMQEGSDSDWTMALGVYPSYSFGRDGEYGTAFAMLGAHTSFKNDGFATTASNGSTIQEDGFVPMVGGGYGFHAHMFHVEMLGYVPIGSSIDYGAGFTLSVGLDLELWHPRGRPQPSPQPPPQEWEPR